MDVGAQELAKILNSGRHRSFRRQSESPAGVTGAFALVEIDLASFRQNRHGDIMLRLIHFLHGDERSSPFEGGCVGGTLLFMKEDARQCIQKAHVIGR